MCSIKSDASGPEVIALDFYDGPTEGYVQSLREHGPCYFKVIAWDDAQDQRLFAATKVEGQTISKLMDLLELGQGAQNSTVCVPHWKFHTSRQEKQADDIVESSQQKLRLSGFLVLGSRVTDATAKEIEYGDELSQPISSCLSTDSIDAVSNWLAYFE